VNLEGKVSLVTGGTRMGREIALALARQGCRVAMLYRRSRSEAEATVRAVRNWGVEAMALRVDLARAEDLDRAVPSVEKKWRRLDVLVNMASMYERVPLGGLAGKPSGRARPSWRRALNTDLRAAYLLSLRAAPLMRRTGGGRIINFSDWTAVSGRPRYKDRLPYYVAKTGVKGLTESLALELAPAILVNAVAPGPILPPAGLSRSENRDVVRATPLRRWGGPEEITKAVLFFIHSDFVTGECLRVDGGRHLC